MLHLCRSYGASLGHRHAASSVTHAIALAWRAFSTDAAERTVDFGYRQVPEDKKEGMVGGVFTSVAGQYDLMNDLMSAGLHRLWKDRFVQGLGLMPGMTHLDVAGGTGDIAFRSVRVLQAAERGTGLGSTSSAAPATSAQGRSRVVVLDLNEEMLKHGQQRAERRGLAGAGMLEWIHGNAEELPLPDGSVDVYTCAFGIRNVTHIDRALAEAHRVLKKGGSFSCLEFSRVRNPVLQQLYDSYSFLIIPQLGRLVANDRDSYTYLVESIRKFPAQEEFAAMIRQAGFKCVAHQDLTAGVVAIHTAVKL